MSDASILYHGDSTSGAFQNLQAKEEDTVPGCKGCGHARSGKPKWMLFRSSRKLMTGAAHDGCHICPILLQGVDQVVAENGELGSDIFSLEMAQTGAKTMLVRLPGAGRVVSFYIKENSPLLSSFLPSWPVGYNISGDTSSNESFAWLVQRLQHCDNSHEICRATSKSSLPKRVLDISDFDDHRVRLYLSEGETERYACLTHCWGTQELLRMVSTNIKSYENNIPWNDLPLTYQHTVILIRKLNIRFLWIDSLCIIQDDEDDWRQEAAKMASTYQGSYLTVSASMSADAGGGLFAIAPTKLKRTYNVPFSGTPDQPQDVFARLYLTHLGHRAMSSNLLREKLPVFTRGWILQERLLSSRVLHFGPEELSYECLEETSCECSGVVTERAEMPYFSSQPKLYHGFAHWKGYSADSKLIVRWHNLVEEYTSLELSHEQDIFPAISGLAKEFDRVKKSPYYVGLWRNSLLRDLLWHSMSSYEDIWPCRPRVWRAPTWSWASIKGRINYMRPQGLTEPCNVVDVSCSPAGPDPTGEVTGGYLILRGLMVNSKLRYRKTDYETRIHSLYELELLTTPRRMGNVYADYNSLVEERGDLDADMVAYCFKIGRNVPLESVYYLLLRYVGWDADVGCQIYERIGLVELFTDFGVKGEETVVMVV